MGKGNRNRENRILEDLESPKKAEKKTKRKPQKRLPGWAVPTLCVVVLVAVIAGCVFAALLNNGTFNRNKILVESKTGKYDVNQQMATFLAWEYAYYYGYYSYQNADADSDDWKEIKDNYKTADSYALDYAIFALRDTPRGFVDMISGMLPDIVAVCDLSASDDTFSLSENEWDDLLSGSWMSITYTTLEEWQKNSDYVTMDVFVNYLFGNLMDKTGMRDRDVKDAIRLICTYQKYYEMKYDSFASEVTEDEIQNYIKENPSTFYSTKYLTFDTTDTALRDALKAATDEKGFKKEIAKYTFNQNYKKWYEQLTAGEPAEAAEIKLSKLTAETAQKAFDEVGTVAQTYSSDNNELSTEMKNWLFGTTKRKAYDVDTLQDKEGNYHVIVWLSESANGDVITATVSEKVFAVTDGESHGTDTDFRSNILKELMVTLEYDDSEKPTVEYKTAKQNAEALKEKLAAMSKDDAHDEIEKMVTYAHLDEVTEKSEHKNVPTAVWDQVMASDVKAGDLYVVEDSGEAYILLITAVGEDGKVSACYASVDADLYFQLIALLQKDIEKETPSEKTASYTDPDGENVKEYQKWLFEGAAKNDFKSQVNAGDVNCFESTVKKGETETTTYSVYMVVGTPMELSKSIIVDGGYTTVEKDKIDSAKASLADKKGAELTAELTKLNSKAIIGSELYTDYMSAGLKIWFTNEAREANDYTVMDDGTVAVYLGKDEQWHVQGKYGVAGKKTGDWIDNAAKDYTVNESVLKRFGEVAETTGDTTAAAAEK